MGSMDAGKESNHDKGSVLQAQSNSSRARSASISDRKRGKLDQASNPGRTTSPTSRSRRRARSRRSSRNPDRRRTRTRRRSGSRSSSKSSACKRDELLSSRLAAVQSFNSLGRSGRLWGFNLAKYDGQFKAALKEFLERVSDEHHVEPQTFDTVKDAEGNFQSTLKLTDKACLLLPILGEKAEFEGE
ncbi:unnamed protein product [Cladocopium goreaui]|uniref:Uncharacterized protein n=1 Tax=Cladocopium goreaui TaxID=2562237 RepID=A0A9P1DAY0_9DINO|nr:unnamed protein product [Cladocopium goreaui]